MKHPESEHPTEAPGAGDQTGHADPAADASSEVAQDSLDAAEPEAAPIGREAELEAELSETKDRMLRAMADLENLRRRSAREIDEARKYGITGFARELLDVDDNLSRALDSIPKRGDAEIGMVKTLAEGVAMTQKALAACFERHHIAKVMPEVGEKFDHNVHQAMFEVEADQAPGTIAQVLQPGYVIADRLLRPAMVGVAKAPAAKADTPPPSDPPQDPVDRSA
ncbi:MAG: nucleotide exchange factor GrpE [Pseudomonadota bacterium]